MTDQELDQMMRRALLDAAAQEAEALPQEPPELSPRHGRSMRAMLRDPLAWARSRRRPALRTAARHAQGGMRRRCCWCWCCRRRCW